MKKTWIIFFLVVLTSLVFYYYRFYRTKQAHELEGYSYNEYTNKWEKARVDSKGIDPSKITKNSNKDGLYNYSVLKGYFNTYDEKSQILHVKIAISFTQNTLFEPAQLKLATSQTIYCVPETYTDPNTGKSYSLQNLRIPVKDDATLFVPGEKIISFDDFIKNSTERTFVLIQLTKDFDQDQDNYIKKIIVTNLCD